MTESLDLPLERGRLTRELHGLTIELAPTVRPLLKLGLFAWLGMAAAVMAGLATSATSAEPEVKIVFMSIFGLFAAIAVFLLTWSAAGCEVVRVERNSMRVSRHLCGVPWGTKTFDLRRVKEMRVDDYWTSDGDAVRAASLDGWSRMFGLTGGVVAFEHGHSTHRFGALISAGDARIVIANIVAIARPGVDEIDLDRPILRRALMIERRGGVLIEVPPSRVRSTAGVALLFMAILLVMMLVAALGDVQGLEDPFLWLPALAFWVVMFIWAGFVFAMTMWRQETIAVDDNRLVVERRLLGVVQRVEFVVVPEARLWLDEGHSDELRMGGYSRRGAVLPTSLNVGPIVYQAPGRTVRFGDGLSRTEAQHIVHRIHEKSPSLVN